MHFVEDAVFMENSEHLADYIFAETGRIFMGNYRHTISRPWVYGQVTHLHINFAI